MIVASADIARPLLGNCPFILYIQGIALVFAAMIFCLIVFAAAIPVSPIVDVIYGLVKTIFPVGSPGEHGMRAPIPALVDIKIPRL